MDIEAQIAEIRASGRSLDDILDGLILADGASPLEVMWVVMAVSGVSLMEAKSRVMTRCHELKNADAIAASAAWVGARVSEIRASGLPLEDVVEDFLEGGSGHTTWEPTGLVERAQVLAGAYGLHHAKAVEAIVSRRYATGFGLRASGSGSVTDEPGLVSVGIGRNDGDPLP